MGNRGGEVTVSLLDRRAYSQGRGESVTRGDRRQRELEFESPLPPLARPCESDGAGGILAPGLWAQRLRAGGWCFEAGKLTAKKKS